MAYGLTWTGLSETLVAGRGAADSPLSRKGLLRLTGKTTIRAVIAATCCRRCNSVRERWSSIGRAAFPGARRIFCGAIDAMRRRRGFSRNEDRPNDSTGRIDRRLVDHVPYRNRAFCFFSSTPYTCNKLQRFIKYGRIMRNYIFGDLHDQCASTWAHLGSGWETTSADLLLNSVWHSQLAHGVGYKLSMAACTKIIFRSCSSWNLPFDLCIGR